MTDVLLSGLAAAVNVERLLDLLCPEPWQRECGIYVNYRPPNALPHIEPRCVIKHGTGKDAVFLRYSKGPGQGHFWDLYGDDYHNRELAILALHEAPAPPRHKLYVEYSIPIGDLLPAEHAPRSETETK